MPKDVDKSGPKNKKTAPTGMRRQVGAICLRKVDGKRKVLLITSRGTGRWVIPKGWPIKGKSLAGAAKVEAWEEAGIRDGKMDKKPMGRFTYVKQSKGANKKPIEILVFKMKVTKMRKRFPEYGQRKLAWYSPKKAAKLVMEPELQALLRSLK